MTKNPAARPQPPTATPAVRDEPLERVDEPRRVTATRAGGDEPPERADQPRRARMAEAAAAPRRLGPLIVVTDRRQAAEVGRHLLDVLSEAEDGGARTILLREKDLPVEERSILARAVAELLAPVEGTLLVASDVALATSVGAVGVHLAAADPAERTFLGHRRSPGDDGRSTNGHDEGRRQPFVGRSCHSVAELRAALAEGADYATLSPVWTTPSKPGYGPALGPDGLARAVEAVPELPIYALGGIGPGRAAACRVAGAAGVAVMGQVMQAADPASTVRALLSELSTEPPPS